MMGRDHSIGLACVALVMAGGPSFADDPVKPPTVRIARPVVRDVVDFEMFTGHTAPSQLVEVRPRVTGQLLKVLFQEGSLVKAGDPLFEIDPRLYQLELQQAQSRVQVHKASLDKAQKTLEADQKAPAGFVSQLQLGLDMAGVAEARARIQGAQAEVNLARLNLDSCKIAAPIGGRIGRCLLDVGNIVTRDQSHLATIIVTDPLSVNFDVDEQRLRRLHRLQKELPEGKVTLSVTSAIDFNNDKDLTYRGELHFVDPQLDARTGQGRARGILANPDGALLPGTFVYVRVALSAPHKSLLIDDGAILEDGAKRFVYVLDAENKIVKRLITMGQRQPDGLRVISEGLKPEDRIVTGEQESLRPGMTVQPVEADAKSPQLEKSPQPREKSEPPVALLMPPSRRMPSRDITVAARYPGASAQAVSDTVRGPIEEQMKNLDDVRSIRSRCTSDGLYLLNVRMAPRVDPQLANLLVKNQLSMATPVLPEVVYRLGMEVQRGSSGIVMLLNVVAKNDRYDAYFLNHYASAQLRDELGRTAGISEVIVLGGHDITARVSFDPLKLAAKGLDASTVMLALLEEQRKQPGDLEKLPDRELKAPNRDFTFRLRDIGRLELGAHQLAVTTLRDGRPAATIVLAMAPGSSAREVAAAVQEKLAMLRQNLPRDLAIDDTFSFAANLQPQKGVAAPGYVVIDLDSAAVTPERLERELQTSSTLVQKVMGVEHVLAMCENPFDPIGGRPCLLVRMSADDRAPVDREAVIHNLRKQLGMLGSVKARVRDLSQPGAFPHCGYPLHLIVSGPKVADVNKWAAELGQRIARSDKLTDVWVNPDSRPIKRQLVEINGDRATKLGVSVSDIATALELIVTPDPVDQSHLLVQRERFPVVIEPARGVSEEDLAGFQVRNAQNDMVRLASLVTIRTVESPLALDFYNLSPMVEITANPAPGVSREEARQYCLDQARNVLPAEGRVTWLP